MTGAEEARWSQFCGGLLGFIDDYYYGFIETDFEIELDMDDSEILEEIWHSTSIDDFSPQLRKVAEQYFNTSYKYDFGNLRR